MINLNSLATAIALIILVSACDFSERNTNLLEKSDNIGLQTEDLDYIKNTKSSINLEQVEEDNLIRTEVEPNYIHIPSYQTFKSINLPEISLEKITIYFYQNLNSEKVIEKEFIEDDNRFRGHVIFNDGTTFKYDLQKNKNNFKADVFQYDGNFEMSQGFSEFQKSNIYKMLEISGSEDPHQFFKELLNSPEITSYVGCTIKQKKILHGTIELAYCKEDDVTILSLYNP